MGLNMALDIDRLTNKCKNLFALWPWQPWHQEKEDYRTSLPHIEKHGCMEHAYI